jgi:hypothetical protein
MQSFTRKYISTAVIEYNDDYIEFPASDFTKAQYGSVVDALITGYEWTISSLNNSKYTLNVFIGCENIKFAFSTNGNTTIMNFTIPFKDDNKDKLINVFRELQTQE